MKNTIIDNSAIKVNWKDMPDELLLNMLINLPPEEIHRAAITIMKKERYMNLIKGERQYLWQNVWECKYKEQFSLSPEEELSTTDWYEKFHETYKQQNTGLTKKVARLKSLIKMRDLDGIKKIITTMDIRYLDFIMKDANGRNVLELANELNFQEALDHIFNLRHYDDSPLFWAVRCNQLKAIDEYLADYEVTSVISFVNKNVADIAIDNNRLETLKILIKSNGDKLPPVRISSIFKAIEQGNTELVDYLLQNFFPANTTTNRNDGDVSMADIAIKNNRLEILQILVKYNKNKLPLINPTYIHNAITKGHIKLFDYLLSFIPSLYINGEVNGKTMADVAIENNRFDIFLLLVKHNQNKVPRMHLDSIAVAAKKQFKEVMLAITKIKFEEYKEAYQQEINQ